MTLLSLKKVSKTYKNYRTKFHKFIDLLGFLSKNKILKSTVLKEISFDINYGESLAIIGANGAGKSTLLKIITGVVKQTEGKVFRNGKISSILELGIGFHQDFSGVQNIFLSLQLIGINDKEISKLLPEIISFADIGEAINQPVRTYSSGMQARLAFSVATCIRPDILIVDEVLSVGDAFFQNKCFSRINKYIGLGTSLIFVTHNIEDITKLCKRAIYLKEGSIVADGPSKIVSLKYLDDLFSNNKKNNTNYKSKNKLKKYINFNHSEAFNTRIGYNKNEYRWGDGGAKIVDFITESNDENYPKVIKTKDAFNLYLKIFFQESFNDIAVGFFIKTVDGVFLYGSNSNYLNPSEKISVLKNDVKVFKFSMPIMLNTGTYFLSVGVSSIKSSEFIPLDRRYDSILLNISNEKKQIGIVNFGANFEIYH